MNRAFSRRTVVRSSLAISALAGVSAHGNALAQTPVASPNGGEWTWTDDRGVTVTLPQRPTRIIAQSTAAVSLAQFGVPIAGNFGSEDPRQSIAFPEESTIDLDSWEFLGPWGEFDLETAIATGAELYVDLYRGEGDQLWGLYTPELQESVGASIPVIGVTTYDVPPTDTIARFEALAGALGVDLDADEQVAVRQAHTDAEAAFVAAVEAKPGLTVLGVTGDPTTSAYILNPVLLGDLQYFASLGLEVVVPENPDPAQLDLFETLAWEELGRYDADVVIYDFRFDPPTGDPIWDSLPAVQAGQVGTWYASLGYSWPELTRYLQSLTATVSASEPLD